MKRVGIIGGLGPESTVAYYHSIITSYREQKQDESYPSIIINSIDLSKVISLVTANELDRLTSYLLDEVQRLAKAGADFGVLSANTPHIIFDDLSRLSPIPLLSIVKETCQAARDSGLKRLGLFGTRFTMQAGFYQDTFSNAGITLILPDENEQSYLHDKYLNEFVKGIFLPQARERLLMIANSLKEQEGIEGLILGGTELPLILRDEDAKRSGLPFLDTTQIHVQSIVAQLLSAPKV